MFGLLLWQGKGIVSVLPILGYRIVRHLHGDFYSVSQPYQWSRGLNTAECIHTHQIPTASCSCGFYSFHLPAQARQYNSSPMSDFVTVAVGGSGKALVYSNGWRAEKAAILAIVDSTHVSPKILVHARDYFRVPLLPIRRLERVVTEFAQARFHSQKPPVPVPVIPAFNPLATPSVISPNLFRHIDSLLLTIEKEILSGQLIVSDDLWRLVLRSLRPHGYVPLRPRPTKSRLYAFLLHEQSRALSLGLGEEFPEVGFEGIENPSMRLAAQAGLLVYLSPLERRSLSLYHGLFGFRLTADELDYLFAGLWPIVGTSSRAHLEIAEENLSRIVLDYRQTPDFHSRLKHSVQTWPL